MGVGQSSVEYLVTYGWMILAAGIAGSLAFSAIGQEESSGIKTTDSSGSFPTISSVTKTEDNWMAVELTNPMERTADIKEVTFVRNGTTVYSSDLDSSVNGRSSIGIRTANYRSSQETKEYKVKIRYGPDLVSESSFEGKISIIELVADFDFEPKAPQQGEEITFNATDSEDSEIINEYTWNFGGSETATGPVVNHTFEESGIYAVRLNITDSEGNSAHKTRTIPVGEVIFSSGGALQALSTNNLASSCIGEGCVNSSQNDRDPVDIGGGVIGGTLLTNKINQTSRELCVTSVEAIGNKEGCKNQTSETGEYLSTQNTTMRGSLTAHTIKPFEKLCVGDSCDNGNR